MMINFAVFCRLLLLNVWAVVALRDIVELSPQHVLQGALAQDWEHEGVLALQSGVLELFAGMVPGRPPKSRLWTRLPLDAPEGLELKLDFEMSNNRPEDPKVHGFAVWYTQTKPPSSLPLELLGGASDFDGIATFFSTRGRNGATANSVSGAWNDGSQMVTIREVPSQRGVYWNFRGQPINFRLVMSVNGVQAQAKAAQADRWNDMFTLTGANLYKPGGYLGITAMGDLENAGGGAAADAGESLRIHNLVLTDLSAGNAYPNAPVNAPNSAKTPEELSSLILARLEVLQREARESRDSLRDLQLKVDAIISGMPSERILSTNVEVINSHLSSFKKDLDEHKRLTHHLFTATNDEKKTLNLIHMEGIKNQVEKHAKVTWLVFAMLLVTVGCVGAIVVKNFYMPQKTHVF